VDKRGDKITFGVNNGTAHDLLYGLLVERKIQSSLVRAGVIKHFIFRSNNERGEGT
jgi:hypothetical protein